VSTTIERNWVVQFKERVLELAQQKRSKLLPSVMQESMTGEFLFQDQVGLVSPVELTARHQKTPYTEVPHSRRRLAARDFVLSEIIDAQDTARMLTSPQSAYARTFANAFERQMDRAIIEAMFAPAATGKSGETIVNFPAGQSIAVDYVEGGTAVASSLTLGKLRRARELLVDVGADEDELYIACTQREISAMLRTIEYGSYDYNMARPLEDGGDAPKRFMGFTWFVLPNQFHGVANNTMFDLDGSNHRRIPCWGKSGVMFGSLINYEINAAPDPTVNFNTRLHARASFGSTRLEEARVVEIKCSTTAF
jgi:hypothetical protein